MSHGFDLDKQTILEIKVTIFDYWKHLEEYSEAQKRLRKELEEQEKQDKLFRKALEMFLKESA